jgi:hypothetical protein
VETLVEQVVLDKDMNDLTNYYVEASHWHNMGRPALEGHWRFSDARRSDYLAGYWGEARQFKLRLSFGKWFGSCRHIWRVSLHSHIDDELSRSPSSTNRSLRSESFSDRSGLLPTQKRRAIGKCPTALK